MNLCENCERDVGQDGIDYGWRGWTCAACDRAGYVPPYHFRDADQLSALVDDLAAIDAAQGGAAC